MVRNYTGEKIPPESVERILDAARRAPSAGFAQGTSFVVVSDPERRSQIAEVAGEAGYVSRGFDPWISHAPVIVVLCTSERAYRDRYAEPDKAQAETREWPVPWWWVDAGCSMMLLLLAAVDEGLAAGFCGVRKPSRVREILAIPQEVTPVGLVTIGRPAPDRRSGSLSRGPKPREEVVHLGRWGSPG